jgi:hypothetical protein
MPGVEYGGAWIRAFVERASGLVFDDAQAAHVASLAEQKLIDLFSVAEEVALANGRSRIFLHDLPLTKGLRALLGEVEPLARDPERRLLLVFLADARLSTPLDEKVKAEIPRLMAALLLLAGRVISLVEPAVSPAERLERLLRSSPNRRRAGSSSGPLACWT